MQTYPLGQSHNPICKESVKELEQRSRFGLMHNAQESTLDGNGAWYLDFYPLGGRLLHIVLEHGAEYRGPAARGCQLIDIYVCMQLDQNYY